MLSAMLERMLADLQHHALEDRDTSQFSMKDCLHACRPHAGGHSQREGKQKQDSKSNVEIYRRVHWWIMKARAQSAG